MRIKKNFWNASQGTREETIFFNPNKVKRIYTAGIKYKENELKGENFDQIFTTKFTFLAEEAKFSRYP